MVDNIGVHWKVNTASMLNEVLTNPGTSIFIKPFQIFGGILHELGERAAELNDPKLNAIMCKLAIYEISDPYHPNYDAEAVSKIMDEAYKK